MIKSGLEYHRKTSYQRHAMQPHFMDWGNTPRTYKDYPEMPRFALEPTGSYPRKNIRDLLDPPVEPAGNPEFGIGTLSDVLLLSYTLTAKRQMGSQTMLYRSVPSAGALYPTELYVCAHRVPGLEPGDYYYDIHGATLNQLRCGDAAAYIDTALMVTRTDQFAATIILSGIFFRSSWKYRTRAFRYVPLDTGHLLENVVLALNLYELPHAVHYDFDDDCLHQLIGVDGKREAGFVCIQICSQTGSQQLGYSKTAGDLLPLNAEILDASQVSAHENTDETISTIYRLGATIQEETTAADLAPVTDLEVSDSFSIEEPDKPASVLPYAETVLNRRSMRAFRSSPYPCHHLMQLVSLLYSPMPTGVEPDSSGKSTMSIGFLAANVADVAPGFYLLDPVSIKCQLVKTGNLNDQMATVCLDQDWLRQAPLHFLFMSNLDQLERRFGSRGYRYDLLKAGRMGQRLYMGATAMGDGCCGIGALYDQEARDLLGLNEGSYLLYLVAVGQPSKKQ